MIEYSGQIEQDIPTSCSLASMPIPIHCHTDQFTNTSGIESGFEENDSNRTHLGWTSKPQKLTTSQDQSYALDEISLGSFKQRVIAAFSI